VDRFEKLLSYRTLERLEEYLLVTQDYRQVARGWRPEVYVEGEVPLTSVGLTLGFDELYRRVL